MTDLAGKVALVTGAGRGIGRAVALLLAERGMSVGVNDLDPARVERTVAEIVAAGGQAAALPANVAVKEGAAGMVAGAEAELGPLWLLVNVAGVFNAGPTAELSEEAWDAAFAVDAKGVFLCSQAAIRRMMPRRAGRIVNFASIGGQIARTEQIAYCSAKAAAIHFSRCLAVEMAPHGITVNCICPGMTATEMLSQLGEEHGLEMDGMVELIPAGRLAAETDHAHLVAYFASEAAGHVTGQVVAVDGAQSLYHPMRQQRP
jgi:NAD(P)-dependent dehydrogenase (short-subunit alcohol dehydrogenase family)